MSKIEVLKEPNKRLFLIDGHLLCYYTLEKRLNGNIRVEIMDSGGIFKRDCNSITLNKSDFKIVTTDKIKEFLAFHMGAKLGNVVYEEIVDDFGLFRIQKEKVLFT